MQTNPNINLTMLCDFYELTMANGYFKSGMQDTISRICVRAASSARIS